MNRNSSSTCGRKTITEPTPFHTPSTSRERKTEAGSAAAIQLPEISNSHRTPSISGTRRREDGLEHAPPPRPANTSGPATGCRKTRVQAARPLGRRSAAVSRPGCPPGRPTRGTWERPAAPATPWAAGLGMAPARKSNTCVDAFALPRADQRHRRAQFRRRARPDPGVPPRLRRSSAMFRMISVGTPSARIGAASIRWRPRLVESSTSRMASGLGRVRPRPVSTSCATCSSSERGERL